LSNKYRNSKSAAFPEEENGSQIRTKKFSFTGSDRVNLPPPTIPGMISMSKQKTKSTDPTPDKKAVTPPTPKSNTPKKKGKKATCSKNTIKSADTRRKDTADKQKPKQQNITAVQAKNDTNTKQTRLPEQGDTMQRKRQKSASRYPSRKKRNDRPSSTADFTTDAMIQCRFSYSGTGYGFAEPIDTAAAEDIFIAPRDTMDAMTGDLVQVRITGQSRNRQNPEGEITAILEHSVSSIIGTLVQDDDGVYYVKPNNEKLRTPVYVPPKDIQTLGIQNNTKVEVIPGGMPYFIRSRNVTVQRRSANHGRRKRTAEKQENSPFFELTGRISAVFGDADTKEANYAAILHDSGIRTEFPPYVIKAAENVSAEILTGAGRQDNRNRIIFTIDGIGAKDLDDAISLKKTENGYILGVHIADVSHYVPFGSCIDNEARLRGTSVYFTDKVIPMLPQALSNHACSLNADTDKYAISCEITLDKTGKRIRTAVCRSLIRSAVRGVYEEVNDIFANGMSSIYYEKYSHVTDTLEAMRELYRLLAARSEDRGVMELESSEPEILLDDSGFPVEIRPRTRGDAEKMIEQFMLQANMAVAELLKSHELPCLYRIHDEPETEKIKSFAIFAHNLGLSTMDLADYDASDKAKQQLSEKLVSILSQAKEKGMGDIVSSVLLRSMMKAKYVSVCSPHFGLGVPVYCHFTSPIRRYPDLFIHNVLSHILPYTENGILTADTKLPQEAYPKQLAAECAACGISSTETEIAAQNAEWKIEDLYMVLYMSVHVGENFPVTVDSVVKAGIFVRCNNLAEGMLPASLIPDARINVSQYSFQWRGKVYHLGSRMILKLTEADPASGRITFAPPDTQQVE